MEQQQFQKIFNYHKKYCISNENTIAFQPLGITTVEVCNSIAGFEKYQYSSETIYLESTKEIVAHSQKGWKIYHDKMIELIEQEILLLKLNLLSDTIYF